MKPVIKAAKKQEDPFEKYRESMYIDKHRLDEAMVTQPVFYQEVSEGYVHAKSLADASKAEMERLDAMIAAELRITWARTGEKSRRCCANCPRCSSRVTSAKWRLEEQGTVSETVRQHW